MSTSECARFERELVRLLGQEMVGEEREACLARAQSHARNCAECRGAIDLIELAELPASERKAGDDPGEAYWREFNGRVARRIRDEDSAGASAGSRRSWPRRQAVAALVVLALAGLAWLLWPGETVDPGTEATASSVEPLPEALAAYVAESPDEVLRQVELFPGAGESWDPDWQDPSAGLDFPQVEDLSPEARRELLEWLRSESAAGARS